MREDDPIDVRLEVRGRDLGEAYAGFARARIARYGLAGAVEAQATRARIEARGPAALVDMLEVACLLGPAACRVDDIVRVPSPDRHEACSARASSTRGSVP